MHKLNKTIRELIIERDAVFANQTPRGTFFEYDIVNTRGERVLHTRHTSMYWPASAPLTRQDAERIGALVGHFHDKVIRVVIERGLVSWGVSLSGGVVGNKYKVIRFHHE